MKVRTIITINRGLKYKIDDRFYESEMYIPEIIRDRNIITQEEINGVMVIKTDEANRQYKQILR